VIVLDALLVLAVAGATVAALAFVRLPTPLERLHPGSFVAVFSGAALIGAAFATEGVTGQSVKMVLIVIVLILSGALANHAVGRALHLRGGERR
jgi:multicomponent Na+:H+ antiporter subunit G